MLKTKKTAPKHNLTHYLITTVWLLIKGIISATLWVIIGIIGFFLFFKLSSPLNLVLGFPMVLIGIGMCANSLSTGVYSLFLPKYNQGVCLFCSSRYQAD